MRQFLAPLLFDDHDTAARDAQRTSSVAKARALPAARAKAASKHADSAVSPVRSLRTLLADPARLTRNVVRIGQGRVNVLLASPTP